MKFLIPCELEVEYNMQIAQSISYILSLLAMLLNINSYKFLLIFKMDDIIKDDVNTNVHQLGHIHTPGTYLRWFW